MTGDISQRTAQESAMTTSTSGPSRRQLLMGGAGLLGGTLLGTHLLGGSSAVAAPAAPIQHPVKRLHLAGTDGWVSMPADAPQDLPFFPDPLAPSPFNTYVFGFRDVT